MNHQLDTFADVKKITRLPSKLYIYHYKSVFWKCYQHITSHHGLYPTQMDHKLISHKHQSNKQCSSSRFNASRLLLKEIRHMTLIMLTVMKTPKNAKSETLWNYAEINHSNSWVNTQWLMLSIEYWWRIWPMTHCHLWNEACRNHWFSHLLLRHHYNNVDHPQTKW